MIFRILAACAVVGAATCFVGTAVCRAQGERDQELQSGSIVALAGAEPVQKELGLGADVAAKIKEIGAAYRDELAKERTKASGGVKLKDIPEADREQFAKKIGEIRKGLEARYGSQVQSAITPEQFTRLQQISWQVKGSQAYIDREVARSLVLTKEQRTAIIAINKEYGQKQRALVTDRGVANRDEAISKLVIERNEKAAELLTKEQRETLTTLFGRPFTLPPPPAPKP